jgi:hypothetical protein
MKNYIIIFFVAFCFPAISCAQQYDFNKRCIDAYTYIQELRFEKGRQLLELEKKENPKNLIPYYVENYIDFLTTYINENEAEFDKLEPNKPFASTNSNRRPTITLLFILSGRVVNPVVVFKTQI